MPMPMDPVNVSVVPVNVFAAVRDAPPKAVNAAEAEVAPVPPCAMGNALANPPVNVNGPATVNAPVVLLVGEAPLAVRPVSFKVVAV